LKKLTIALCLAIAFAFADDPCSVANSQSLSLTASGVQSWEGTKNASTLSGSGLDAIGVEAWAKSGGNKTKLTWFGPNQGGGFAFRAEWTSSDDYLGRLGYHWGTNGSKWNALGDLCVDYNYTRSANGTGGSYSYIGVYGWTIGNNTSAEYYIVEDWYGAGQQTANNLGNGCQIHTDIKVDGKDYQVITCIRPKGEGCVECGKESDGQNKSFGQVFSVRKNMRNPQPATCGTISIKKHFEEWIKQTTEKSGQSPAKYIYDKTYESKFLTEAEGGTGWFEASFLKFSRSGSCGIVIPPNNYTLEIMTSPSNGGTVKKEPVASYYSSGSNVTVTATPASGWKFSSWDGDATGSTNPLTVKMDKNKVVTAKFTPLIDPDKNLVTNGTFANTDGWAFNKGSGYGDSDGSFSVSNNKATLNVTKIGTKEWEPQFVQNGITLVQGMKYRLTFDASASAARKIGVIIQMAGDPYTTYFEDKEVSLTTASKTFTYDFTMEAASDENGRFGFQLGQATGTVTISNVKLNYIAEEPTSSSSDAVITTSSSSGAENPGSSSSDEDPESILKNQIPLTHFSVQTLSDKALRIEVSSPSVVEIFDMKGNKVAKFNVSKTQQTVKLSLPNGVYFAKAHGTKSIRFVLK